MADHAPTLDTLAMWLGYALMLVGGVGLLAVLSWRVLDAVATRLGWCKLFAQHSRAILQAERAKRAAHG